MIPPGDQWGPFAPGIDQAERRARLRSLRALSRVFCGPRAADLYRLLAEAETNPDALEPASVEINRLPPLDRRQILASFARLATTA